MSVEILVEPNDRALADARELASQFPCSTPLGDPRWCSILTESYRAIPVIARQRSSDGEPCGLLGGYVARTIFGGQRAFFGLRSGLFTNEEAVAIELIEQTKLFAQQRGLDQCLISAGRSAPTSQFRFGTRTTVTMKVESSAEGQLKALPGKARNLLRKGWRLGVKVESKHDLIDVAYDLYRDRMVERLVPIYNRRLFHSVIRQFGSDSEVIIARHNGAAVSAMIALYGRNTCVYWINGSTGAARSVNANYVLFAHILDQCRQRGIAEFDMAESTPGGSVHFFKTQFGGRDVPLYYCDPMTGEPPPDNFGSTVRSSERAARNSLVAYLPVSLKRAILAFKRAGGRVI